MFQFSLRPEPLELSLAVVGLRYPNRDKSRSNRAFEANICAPGESVSLVPEPGNPVDPRAVAVFSARGVQLGYLTAERCGRIGSKIAAGEPVEAIFQALDSKVIVIRARFGGGAPTLPTSADRARDLRCDDFHPDPPAPEWGA